MTEFSVDELWRCQWYEGGNNM